MSDLIDRNPVEDFITDLPPVIGLAGNAGAGKSTAAEILARYGGYQRLRFAGPLKAMMRALLSEVFFAERELIERMIEGDLKEHPTPALSGRSPRHAMQTLGTEWGRDCMGSLFWVDLAVERARSFVADGGRVVFEDVRFANEARAIRAPWVIGGPIGQVWRIEGRGGLAGGHASEAAIARLPCDAAIDNSGDTSELEVQIISLLSA